MVECSAGELEHNSARKEMFFSRKYATFSSTHSFFSLKNDPDPMFPGCTFLLEVGDQSFGMTTSKSMFRIHIDFRSDSVQRVLHSG